MNREPYRILQDTRREIGASLLIVANESGEALLIDGHREMHTTTFLAALGAAGLSALQEMVTATFTQARPDEEQMLTLELSKGIILIYSTPPILFLAVLTAKNPLGLARLLLKRLASEYPWEKLLPEARQQLPSLDEGDESQLFASLWEQ